MIVYKMLADGGFVVGDTETRMTAYAYPTSSNATAAKSNPAKIAAAMIKNRTAFPAGHYAEENNAHNWADLEKEEKS